MQTYVCESFPKWQRFPVERLESGESGGIITAVNWVITQFTPPMAGQARPLAARCACYAKPKPALPVCTPLSRRAGPMGLPLWHNNRSKLGHNPIHPACGGAGAALGRALRLLRQPQTGSAGLYAAFAARRPDGPAVVVL